MKVREMPQVVSRVTPAVKAWLERAAKRDERSQNWLIVKALEEAMLRDEEKQRA